MSTVISTRTVGNKLSIFIALIFSVIITYGVHFVFTVRVQFLPAPLRDAGPTQFLTNLSAILSLFYFGLSIVTNLIGNPNLFYIKNNYVLPIIISLEFVVTSVYWSLKLLFTHLIVMVDNVPLSVDIPLHIAPLVGLLFDYFFCLPQFEISSLVAFALCGILATAYWFWLEYLVDTSKGQLYPYPFLNIEHDKRIVVFAIVAMVAFVGFSFLRLLHTLLVKDDSKKSEKDKKD